MITKSDHHFKDACSAWDSGDLAKAFGLFSRAAESGDSSCQLNLGYFYDCGLHVARDQGLARYWYHRAYRQGEASAASNIAMIHRDSHEYSRMIWWWRAAARMGDADALLELGRCYESGCGVPRNRDRAMGCYAQLLASSHVTGVSRQTAEGRLRHLQKHTSRHHHPA